MSNIRRKLPISVGFQVARKAVLSRKIRRAEVALESSLAGVDALMHDHVPLEREALATVVTLVRALSSVLSLVVLHALGVRCGILAH